MALLTKLLERQKVYVQCLYNGHKRHPTILEDEPKYIDAGKLTNVRVNAPHVQASILEFIGILRSREDGYARPGEEVGLEIEDTGTDIEPPIETSAPEDRQGNFLMPIQRKGIDMSLTRDATVESAETGNALVPDNSQAIPPTAPCANLPFTPESDVQYQYDPPYSERNEHSKRHPPPPPPQQAQAFPLTFSHHQLAAPPQQMVVDNLNHTLDIFQPLLDPEMLDLFPNGELPDLSAFDTSTLNLDHFDFEGAS